jgi:hypothetical protein
MPVTRRRQHGGPGPTRTSDASLAGCRSAEKARFMRRKRPKGFVAPSSKNLLLVSNGLLAKFGLWQARRHGTAERLERLAAEKAAGTAG